MRRMQIVILATVGIVLTAATVGFAEDQEAARKSMDPLEIVADCVEAAQQRDFRRYVDHLTEEEQRLQAGYALFVTSMTSLSSGLGGGLTDPETLLLMRALTELVGQHSIPASQRDAEQEAAQEIRQKMSAQVLLAAFTQEGMVAPTYPSTGGLSVRGAFLESTEVLEDPREFLIAVLTEVSRPTVVSGAEPEEASGLTDFADIANAYAGLKWTLYTRGDYAVAVALTPEASESSTPSPASFGLQVSQIEFRRLDGHWKIHHLLPVSGVMPVAYAEPAEPDVSSYPVPYTTPATPAPYPASSSAPPPSTSSFPR